MNNDIRQEAIDYVQKAVINLSRALAVDILNMGNEQNNKIYEQQRAQQKQSLLIWQYILSVISTPINEAIDDLHYKLTILRSDIEISRKKYEDLGERYGMALDTISKLKNEEKALEKLKDMCVTQCQKGNFDVNEYMRGMANGLMLAVSYFTNEEPKFIEPPSQAAENEPVQNT